MDDRDLPRIAVADQRNGPVSGPFGGKGDGPSRDQNRVGVGFPRAASSLHPIITHGSFRGITVDEGRSGGTFPGGSAFLPRPCSFVHLSFGGKFGFLVLHVAFEHHQVGLPGRVCVVDLNMRRFLVIPQQSATKRTPNTTWEVSFSLFFWITTSVVVSGAAHHGVPAEGGLIGEGAAAEATHVGLLSGVDALVPLEGVELGELLVAVLTAVGALACNREGSSFCEQQTQIVSKDI